MNSWQEKIYSKICDRIILGKSFKFFKDNEVINFHYSKTYMEWQGYVYDNSENWEQSIQDGWINVLSFQDDNSLKRYIKELF